MTAATSITIKELLELAALDAFGLLDEYESALYTQSFHHAPATVQDDIKRLQAQIASDESLLPIDEPDPALRDRVLAAVAKAIEADSSKLAPLATIGRPRRTSPETARRVLPASGQFWRAASFVLAGTLLAVAYLWSDANRQSYLIASLALHNVTDAQLVQLVGPTITKFLKDPSAERIVLTPTKSGDASWANVLIREDGSEAFLLFEGLPRTKGGGYKLRVQRADGGTEHVHAFDGTGPTLGGVHVDAIELTAAVLAAATGQITDLAGNVVLRSA